MTTPVSISRRDVAERIVRLLERHGAELNASLREVQSTCTSAEFEAYRRAVAQMMGRAFFDVMEPLYEQHPGLAPESLQNENG
jgi:hypothetical protein